VSILFGRNDRATQTAADLIPRRGGWRKGAVDVTATSAMRHAAVWACLRLRADLISTMPVDVFRRSGALGVTVEVSKPPVLVEPGGSRVEIEEWMYSSQVELDRLGNSFGIITARNGMGLPARIDLVPASDVAVIVKKGELAKYRIAGTEYDPIEIWHEKQFTLPGLHVGLNPTAYAAWSVGAYLSAQQFALDWFGNGAAPSGVLKNSAKTVPAPVVTKAKQEFKEATADRDIFVTGADWEFTFLQVPASETAFMDQMKYGVVDAARFYGVPADMIDAEVATGSITYANVTQRNLQLLIMNIGPAVVRREKALSRLTPKPQYVKLNSDALLRMDPKSIVEKLKIEIDARITTPTEARALMNKGPLTADQLAEFAVLFPSKAPATGPTQGVPA
jgi:HK97 family phage portal protein